MVRIIVNVMRLNLREINFFVQGVNKGGVREKWPKVGESCLASVT